MNGPTPLWDQHACLPLSVDADLSLLDQFGQGCGGFVSINVGYAPHAKAESLALIRTFADGIDGRHGLVLASTVGDVDAAQASGRVGVVFDLEDSAPLDGDLASVAEFVSLGVRTLIPTYNHANAAGGGCLDPQDTGLTSWGRDLVRAMNAAGMVPDGSHCGARTGLEMCEVSDRPVIYSHSCLRSVWDHPRNITDEQARACAAMGGVVGIAGVGIFLGPNTATLPALTAHLEAAVELIGIDHVGVSTDFSFDAGDFLAELAANPGLFDDSYTRWGPIAWMTPATMMGLGDHLSGRGWSDTDIGAVMWHNFRRVAAATW
ncbi:membrane dipeptidase [Sporichthya sp.]|uniref:dipeptidase n=1 Tax=Sporichthya sp. TaxID=65475 RepID=UPI0025EC218B|nr:membrane dipeptidase [Sporichthya sp.]